MGEIGFVGTGDPSPAVLLGLGGLRGILVCPICFSASCKFLLRWGVFFAILDDGISNKQPEVA